MSNPVLRFSNLPGGERPRTALAIGVFDGVHLGHRALIARVDTLAGLHRAVPGALTFFPHPRSVLRPREPLQLLISPEERLDRLRRAGAKFVISLPFTRELADCPPETFLEELFSAPEMELCAVAVGRNWRFGANGRGDIDMLRNFCEQRGVAFAAVDEVEVGRTTVSSSEIRRALAAGKLQKADAMLGYPYMIGGHILHGFRDASERLDCPTANLEPAFGVLPPDGVYAGCVRCDRRVFPAVINVGFAPTFGRENARRRVEAHLLEFNGDLYDRAASVRFSQYLREERTFADVAALKNQSGSDRRRALDFFHSAPGQKELQTIEEAL